jgi:hypothetical protein
MTSPSLDIASDISQVFHEEFEEAWKRAQDRISKKWGEQPHGEKPQVKAIEATPTEKQLDFLKRLGVSSFNGTRQQASKLIEEKLKETHK